MIPAELRLIYYMFLSRPWKVLKKDHEAMALWYKIVDAGLYKNDQIMFLFTQLNAKKSV